MKWESEKSKVKETEKEKGKWKRQKAKPKGREKGQGTGKGKKKKEKGIGDKGKRKAQDEHMCFRQTHVCLRQTLILMIFGRTELMINVSKAKFDVEADGEVHLIPNRQKPDEKCKKLFFSDRTFSFRKVFWCQKIKCRESAEMRFREFSW